VRWEREATSVVDPHAACDSITRTRCALRELQRETSQGSNAAAHSPRAEYTAHALLLTCLTASCFAYNHIGASTAV